MSNNFAIIYLHGFASGFQKGKFKDLENNGFDIYYPTYEPHNVNKTVEFLDKYISDIKHKYTKIIIVGTSMGGLWTDYYGRTYKIPIILNNPLVDVCHSLTKLIGECTNLVTGEKFILTQKHVGELNLISIKTHNMPQTNTHLLINLNDDVLNPNYAINEFKDQPTIKHPDGGHRTMRHNEILSICNDLFT